MSKKSKNKRIAVLPVNPYIKKWLTHSRGYRDRVEVPDDTIVYRPAHRLTVYNWFLNAEERPTIKVSMYYPSKMKLYILHQILEHSFNLDMMTYVQTASMMGIPAMVAMKLFLNRCMIGEEELAIGTAYKRWQRLGKSSLPGLQII